MWEGKEEGNTREGAYSEKDDTVHHHYPSPFYSAPSTVTGAQRGAKDKLTKLPKPLQNTIMHAQPRHNRLRLVGNHQQNRAYCQCEQCDQDDGGEGGDGRSGVWVVGQECLEGFYEACNVCEGCEGAEEGDGEYLKKVLVLFKSKSKGGMV